MALNFTRDVFVASEKPSVVDGVWLGTVQAGGRPLRAQIKVISFHISGKDPFSGRGSFANAARVLSSLAPLASSPAERQFRFG